MKISPTTKGKIVKQVQAGQGVQYRIDPRRNTPRHILIKLTKIRYKERTLKAAREKQQVTYKGNPVCLTTDLSAETLKARKEWQDIFNVMKGKNIQPRLLYKQGSHSKLMEKSKALQTNKNEENLLPPNQLYNKC